MNKTWLIVIALGLCTSAGCKRRGSADVTAAVNTSPRVTRLVAEPTRIDVGETTMLAVDAIDADGDLLAFRWSASCGGVFDVETSATPTFTLTERGASACTLEVRVQDEGGALGTGAVTISSGPEILPNVRPIIGALERSAASAAGGETLLFHVAAHDPEGQPLSFLWSAASGTFTQQSDLAGSSRVSWTAPRCGSDLEPRIEVTVEDARGASVAQSFTIEMRCDACFDGVLNGGETDIDCGGASCSSCVPCEGACTVTQVCERELCVDTAWTPVAGVEGVPVSVAVAPNGGGTPYMIHVATDRGIFSSRDGGTWTRGGPVDALAIASMPMAEAAFASRGDGTVHQTSDGGATWMPTEAAPGGVIRGWAGLSGVGPLGAGSSAGQAVMYRGRMRGASWMSSAPFGLGVATSIAFGGGEVPNAIVYVGVDGPGGGVFRSIHVGSPTMDFVRTSFSRLDVLSVATGASARSSLFVGTSAGVHRSVDGGDSWASAGLEDRAVRALAVDPADAARVHAGTDAGIYVSTDGGSTWVLSGLPSAVVTSIASLNGAPEVVYAASSLGLFVSRTGGL